VYGLSVPDIGSHVERCGYIYPRRIPEVGRGIANNGRVSRLHSLALFAPIASNLTPTMGKSTILGSRGRATQTGLGGAVISRAPGARLCNPNLDSV